MLGAIGVVGVPVVVQGLDLAFAQTLAVDCADEYAVGVPVFGPHFVGEPKGFGPASALVLGALPEGCLGAVEPEAGYRVVQCPHRHVEGDVDLETLAIPVGVARGRAGYDAHICDFDVAVDLQICLPFLMLVDGAHIVVERHDLAFTKSLLALAAEH